MSEQEKVKTINGYELFFDVEDNGLKAYNRATVMCNMIENETHDGVISLKHVRELLVYFSYIPEEERAITYNALSEELNKRGIQLEKSA